MKPPLPLATALLLVATLLLGGCAYYRPGGSPNYQPSSVAAEGRGDDVLMHYDGRGRYTGRTERRGNTLMHYDAQGRWTGSSQPRG